MAEPFSNHNKNLAEGMLVKDALFVAKDGVAGFVADSPAKLENGGFEQFQGDRFTAFEKQDEPGKRPSLTRMSPIPAKPLCGSRTSATTKAGIARVAQTGSCHA